MTFDAVQVLCLFIYNITKLLNVLGAIFMEKPNIKTTSRLCFDKEEVSLEWWLIFQFSVLPMKTRIISREEN